MTRVRWCILPSPLTSTMTTPAPPVLAKWISTRKAGPYLSGLRPINKEAQTLGIKARDVAAFARALAACQQYTKTIYRGVFKDDPVYTSLLLYGEATTTRYYSFAKTSALGEAFGDKIVIVLTPPHSVGAYDISKWSRESEIVLQKGASLYVKIIERSGLFTYLFVETVRTPRPQQEPREG